MKFIIKKNTLLDGLKYANNIIDSNNINPILSAVNITCTKNTLILIATNGENSYKQTYKDVKIEKEGSVLVKARFIYNIIAKLNEEEILINQIDDSILQIKTSNFSCEINLIEKFSFPILNFDHENWNKITLDKNAIFTINTKIVPFTSTSLDNTYNILNGINFNPIDENQAECIATDGFKLAYHTFKYRGTMKSFTLPINAIKMCEDLINNKKLEELTFFTNDRNIIITNDDTIIQFSLFNGNYPDVTKTLLEEQEYHFSVKTKDILSAMSRGYVFTVNERKPAIILRIAKNLLEIKLNSLEIGNSYETIEITNQNIDDLTFKLNNKYLFDIISGCDEEEISFNFNGENKPIIITSKNKDILNLILPIRSV